MWVSPEQELHTFPRCHCHHTAQLGRDAEHGGSGGARKGPGNLMLYHRAGRAQCPAHKNYKFKGVQLKLGLPVQTPSKAASPSIWLWPPPTQELAFGTTVELKTPNWTVTRHWKWENEEPPSTPNNGAQNTSTLSFDISSLPRARSTFP